MLWLLGEGTINLGGPQAHWLMGGRCDGGLLLDGARSSCCMMQCCRVVHPISPQNWTTTSWAVFCIAQAKSPEESLGLPVGE